MNPIVLLGTRMKSVLVFLFIYSLTFSVSTFADTKQKSKLRVKSAKQAAKIVRSRVGGKVLKVRNQKVNGKKSYRVKVIKPSGHITSVSVDAKSGKIKSKGK